MSEVSGTLSGPLPPAEIATKFLQRIKSICPDTTTAAVFMHDEPTTRPSRAWPPSVRSKTRCRRPSFPLAALPDDQRLDPRGTPVVAYDLMVDPTSVGGREAWTTFCSSLAPLQQARSFVLLPLRSRNRLIGRAVDARRPRP